MSRTQSMLSLLLAVQAVLLLLVWSPWSSGSGPLAATPLIPELQSFAAFRIEITAGDERLVLERDDPIWRIEQAEGYPADGSKIQKLLDDVEQIQVRRPVVTSSRYHGTLRVTPADNERHLRIWDEHDEPRVDLFIGSSANYGVNHVRRGDRDEVYEVKGLSPWDMRAEAGSWVETRLVDVEPESVRSLKLTNKGGAFELTRDDAGAWRLASGASAPAELDASAVDSYVRSIATLRLTQPAGRVDAADEYGLDKPLARLDLTYAAADGAAATLDLAIGAEVEGDGGERYARASGSEFAVILSKWDAERILDKKLADLLASGDSP